MKARLQPNLSIDPASFRDASGFVFYEKGHIYRQINARYKDEYDHLIRSGMYDELLAHGFIVDHKEISSATRHSEGAYKVIQPTRIGFLSYPYEWCFSQLKDAALTMLEIQKIAMYHGMSLKDSSAYNIQFLEGKPVLIDTLSFSFLEEKKPWIAYRQFCQHFLAPLVLMSLVDTRFGQLSRAHIDGIPLEMAKASLSTRGLFNIGIWLHLRLHALAQRRYANADLKSLAASRKFSRQSHIGLTESLSSCILDLKCMKERHNWGGYYTDGNVNSEYIEEKKKIVTGYLERVKPGVVWDLGANIGSFSRIPAVRGIPTVSFDSDLQCVEQSYMAAKGEHLKTLLPLFMDITNPSPASGWEHSERKSLLDRGPADLALALALVHHLAISNNLPFEKIASFFQRICSSLVVEFIPRQDPMVEKLLNSRKEPPWDYSQSAFEAAFRQHFRIERSQTVAETQRRLYLMKKKRGGL